MCGHSSPPVPLPTPAHSVCCAGWDSRLGHGSYGALPAGSRGTYRSFRSVLGPCAERASGGSSQKSCRNHWTRRCSAQVRRDIEQKSTLAPPPGAQPKTANEVMMSCAQIPESMNTTAPRSHETTCCKDYTDPNSSVLAKVAVASYGCSEPSLQIPSILRMSSLSALTLTFLSRVLVQPSTLKL